jgi:hypothetical protein
MQVISQLLREFWLPLLLGVAWTVFNVIDNPHATWSIREFLNIFGPTFFFMSWLVAQWYRVKKQQRVEEGLTEIHAGVQALQAPLLPCGLFLTLELVGKDEDVERIFSKQDGFRAYGPDRPMPPPPIGLPPGMSEGRLHRPGGYVDYRNGFVEAAGFYDLKHPGFNTIHRSVQNTICVLDASNFSDAEPFFAKPAAQIEFFFDGKPTSVNLKPSLTLKGSMMAVEVIRAYALDTHIFVDFGARSLSPTPLGSSWSTNNLKRAFIRVTIDFFYIMGVMHLPKESWPALHNVQLWFGSSPNQLLTFSVEQLRTQITRENPKPLATGQAVCPQILFEFQMDAAAFSGNLISVA